MRRRNAWLVAASIVILLAIVLALTLLRPEPKTPEAFIEASRVPMQRLTPVDSAQLSGYFEAFNYDWPPSDRVPAIAVHSLPTDFGQLDTEERRSLFLRSLLPLVLAENHQLLRLRKRVLEIDQQSGELNRQDHELLSELFERYRIVGEPGESEARQRLLRRLDAVPPELALAQAANESGWGTSRFTREANNLFGEWTWDPDAGLKPRQRRAGATHFVRVFPDLESSVRTYILNLNVGHAYGDFRSERERMRNQDEPLDGLTLAGTLERYSERGLDYIDEIRAMIRFNNLHQVNSAELALAE